jgi:hypothetical protein
MNRGDIETFYPMQAGGLESSSFLGFKKEESRATGDDIDDSKDDQESVEFEDSDAVDAGGVSDADMPTFRQLVRAKKTELKAQYGKGRFDNKTAYKRVCAGGFVDIKGDGKPPIWKSDINCTNVPYPEISWIPGWRKQWRIFKRDGGLAQLKMKSRGLLTPQEQAALDNSPTPTPPPVNFNGYSCSQLISEFNIIPGKSFGTAPVDAITAWRSKKCTGPAIKINKPDYVQRTSGEEDASGNTNKKMFIFGAIALVIIIAILLIIMVVKSKKTS